MEFNASTSTVFLRKNLLFSLSFTIDSSPYRFPFHFVSLQLEFTLAIIRWKFSVRFVAKQRIIVARNTNSQIKRCSSVQVAAVIGRDRIYFSSDWITSTVWKFLFRLLLFSSTAALIRSFESKKFGVCYSVVGLWWSLVYRLFVYLFNTYCQLIGCHQSGQNTGFLFIFSVVCVWFSVFSVSFFSHFSLVQYISVHARVMWLLWIFQLQTDLFFSRDLYIFMNVWRSRLIEFLYVVCERRQVPAAWISNQYRTRTTKTKKKKTSPSKIYMPHMTTIDNVFFSSSSLCFSTLHKFMNFIFK